MTVENINLLPDEILLNVFSLLDKRNLQIARLVCKKWEKLSTDDSIWTRILKIKPSPKLETSLFLFYINSVINRANSRLRSEIVARRDARGEANHLFTESHSNTNYFAMPFNIFSLFLQMPTAPISGASSATITRSYAIQRKLNEEMRQLTDEVRRNDLDKIKINQRNEISIKSR